jgi:serine/threonine-protein kinase
VAPADAGKPTLAARSGASTRTFAATRAGPGRWRARVVLAAPGRWALSARVRGRTFALGPLLVTAPPADLVEPFSVALAPDGTVVVADRAGRRVVRIDPATGRSATVAGTGEAGFSGDGGPATAARMNEVIEVAAEANGDVYVVADERIRRVDAATGVISTIVGTGERTFGPDGVSAARSPLSGPTGLAVAADGDLLIAEYDNKVRRIDAQSGLITTVMGDGSEGSGGDGGPARAARVNHPHGVAVFRDGSIVVADTANGRLRRIGTDGVVRSIPGSFGTPIDVTEGPDGSLYVVGDNVIRRLGPDGAVRTVAGTGSAVSSGDGGPATRAGLNVPNSVAVAADGTLYISEFESRRVRRVDGRTGVITTVAR